MGKCLFVSLGIKDLRTRCFCPPIFLPGRGILRPDSKFCVFFQFRKFCVCIDGTFVLSIYLFGYFISSRLDSFRVAASDVGLITNLVLEMYNSGQASRKWFLDTVSCVEREREITTTTFEKLQNSAFQSLKYVTIHGGPVWGGNMTAIPFFLDDGHDVL